MDPNLLFENTFASFWPSTPTSGSPYRLISTTKLPGGGVHRRFCGPTLQFAECDGRLALLQQYFYAFSQDNENIIVTVDSRDLGDRIQFDYDKLQCITSIRFVRKDVVEFIPRTLPRERWLTEPHPDGTTTLIIPKAIKAHNQLLTKYHNSLKTRHFWSPNSILFFSVIDREFEGHEGHNRLIEELNNSVVKALEGEQQRLKDQNLCDQESYEEFCKANIRQFVKLHHIEKDEDLFEFKKDVQEASFIVFIGHGMRNADFLLRRPTPGKYISGSAIQELLRELEKVGASPAVAFIACSGGTGWNSIAQKTAKEFRQLPVFHYRKTVDQTTFLKDIIPLYLSFASTMAGAEMDDILMDAARSEKPLGGVAAVVRHFHQKNRDSFDTFMANQEGGLLLSTPSSSSS
jgi:hypothetical protein